MRNRKQRGSALLVALIMICVIATVLELLLAAPSAELLKVRSTDGKERSMASADAGVRDSIAYLYANSMKLTTNMTDPVSSSIASGGNVVLTLASLNYGAGGASSQTLTQALNMSASGIYPFPTFATSSFVRFGDTGGQYAYRIASLGNGYYQVDSEGRALGAGGAACWTVSRLTAVAYLPQPISGNLPGTLCWCGPGSVASSFANPSTSPAPNPPLATTWTAVTVPSNPPGVNLVCATPTQGGTLTGIDAQGSYNTAAFAIQGTDLGVTPASSVDQQGYPVQGYVSAVTTPTRLATTDPVWTEIANFVNAAQQAGGWDPSSKTWSTANTTGTLSATSPPTIATAGLAHFTYGAGPVPANANWTTTIDPTKFAGLIYLRVPAGTVIDTAQQLITVSGTSATPAGLLVIDLEDPVTFVNNGCWFLDHGNPSAVSGGVIIYQRGRVNLPTTNGLGWIDSNGSFTHGMTYNSQAVNKALNTVHVTPRLVSYVVVL